MVTRGAVALGTIDEVSGLDILIAKSTAERCLLEPATAIIYPLPKNRESRRGRPRSGGRVSSAHHNARPLTPALGLRAVIPPRPRQVVRRRLITNSGVRAVQKNKRTHALGMARTL